jgi:hypothetical protein
MSVEFGIFRAKLDQYGSDMWHYTEVTHGIVRMLTCGRVTHGSIDVDMAGSHVAVRMLTWHCMDIDVAWYGCDMWQYERITWHCTDATHGILEG